MTAILPCARLIARSNFPAKASPDSSTLWDRSDRWLSAVPALRSSANLSRLRASAPSLSPPSFSNPSRLRNAMRILQALEKRRLSPNLGFPPSRSSHVFACASIWASISVLFRRCYGPEFIEKALRGWPEQLSIKTLLIEPGSPLSAALRLPAGQCRGKRYCESFNSKLRDELLAREVFCIMKEAKTILPRAYCSPYPGNVAV
jgi:hypothetical protein